MKYLKKIELKNDYLCFNKGFKLENLKDVTLLVGDQGSGKSTLLKLLGDNSDLISVELLPGIVTCSTYYFDSEHMNPRTTDPIMYTTPTGKDVGVGFIGATMTRFQSHGEVLVEYTVNALKKAKDSVIFLDEPESGLSLRNQYRLSEAIEEAAKNGCQLMVATHCLPLITSQENVYSMEHRKWMATKEFIKTQNT